jgi:hypothetical protein
VWSGKWLTGGNGGRSSEEDRDKEGQVWDRYGCSRHTVLNLEASYFLVILIRSSESLVCCSRSWLWCIARVAKQSTSLGCNLCAVCGVYMANDTSCCWARSRNFIVRWERFATGYTLTLSYALVLNTCIAGDARSQKTTRDHRTIVA